MANKVSFQKGNLSSYQSTAGAIFFAKDNHSIYLDGSMYGKNYDASIAALQSSITNTVNSYPVTGASTPLSISNKQVTLDQTTLASNLVSGSNSIVSNSGILNSSLSLKVSGNNLVLYGKNTNQLSSVGLGNLIAGSVVSDVSIIRNVNGDPSSDYLVITFDTVSGDSSVLIPLSSFLTDAVQGDYITIDDAAKISVDITSLSSALVGDGLSVANNKLKVNIAGGDGTASANQVISAVSLTSAGKLTVSSKSLASTTVDAISGASNSTLSKASTLSADLLALDTSISNLASAISTTSNNLSSLNVSNVIGTNQYASSISQSNGKISVTVATLPVNAVSGVTASSGTYLSGVSLSDDGTINFTTDSISSTVTGGTASAANASDGIIYQTVTIASGTAKPSYGSSKSLTDFNVTVANTNYISATQTLGNALKTLDSQIATNKSSIDTLNTTVSSHTTSISSLNTTVGTHTTSINTINSSIASIDSELTWQEI